MYGIPRSTLHDHVSGRVTHSKPGPEPYLSLEEEEELANFLLKCARIGYPKTRQQVLALVQDIVSCRRPEVLVTNGWWERFTKRHPHVTLKSAVPLSYVRAMAQDESSIEAYYNLLETTLRQNGIFDSPAQIFNCDETEMPLNPKPLKIVGERGAKNPSYICGSIKNQVTVLACTSASGYALPPYVILARKTLNQEITYGEVAATSYGLSPKGWMDLTLFNKWFKEQFLRWAPPALPLLLLMDGHASHFCPNLIRTAAAEGIILFALPPHTTHLCQPLDKGAFSPLKMEWRKSVHKFISTNKGREVTIYDFSSVFSEAWSKAMSINNVTAGFKVAGVFPFNRNAVKLQSEKFKKFNPQSLSETSGIKYIPLYSPSRTTDGMHDLSGEQSTLEQSPVLPGISPTPARSLIGSEGDIFRKFLSFLPASNPKCLKEFLPTPQAPKRSKGRGPVPPGRVLTSKENLSLIEEQERKKQEAARLKEERKRERETKRLMKLNKSKKKITCEYFLKHELLVFLCFSSTQSLNASLLLSAGTSKVMKGTRRAKSVVSPLTTDEESSCGE